VNARIALLAAPLLLSACALRPHYAELAASSGLKEALAAKAVDEADGVELFARDPATGKPIKGLSLLLWAAQKNYTLVSDASGRLLLPASARMLADNPMYEVTKPAGVTAYALELGAPLDCGPARPAVKLPAKTVLKWPFVDAGPDRLYFEPEVTPEARAAAATLLSELHASLLALTGAEPPPLALVVVAKDAGLARGQKDASGRTLVALSALSLGQPAADGSVTREWAREHLRRTAGYAADARGLVLEQGLLDLFSYAAERLRQGTGATPTVAARLQVLAGRAGAVDLLAGVPREAASGSEARAALCGASEAAGFAWWLGRAKAEHALLPKLFERLATGTTPGSEAVVALVAELSPGGPDARALVLEEAQAVLEQVSAATPPAAPSEPEAPAAAPAP
jgi:hypothetical protein